MPYTKLVVSEPNQNNGNLIILAENETLEQLSSMLSVAEMSFLRHAAAKEVKQFFFPRENSGVWVKLLKPNKNENIALEEARLAGNEILAHLRQYKTESVAIRNTCTFNHAWAFAEGMALGNYQFLKYFSEPEKKEKSLKEISVENPSATATEMDELNALVEAVLYARTLVNEPFSFLDAPKFAEIIEQTGQKFGFSVDVLEKEQLETLKMGGLLAVNKASSTPPRFCIIEYKPDNAKNKKPLVLAGKGVVYDTGGLSLKPSEGMDYMKCDMAGAATVLGVFMAASATQMPVHLIGLIPITDNKVGDKAIVPGDVIRMYSGKTVEMVNTDAEGRIILADALHYAKKYKPELVIDFATLTGAAVKALGNQAICYMGTASQKVKNTIEDSGWATFERLVELPLWNEYGEELKSNIADLKNIGSSNAGMITAGKFLENFTDFPWLHLDIAGPAYLRTANGYRTKEGTGVGIRLMYDFLKKYYSI